MFEVRFEEKVYTCSHYDLEENILTLHPYNLPDITVSLKDKDLYAITEKLNYVDLSEYSTNSNSIYGRNKAYALEIKEYLSFLSTEQLLDLYANYSVLVLAALKSDIAKIASLPKSTFSVIKALYPKGAYNTKFSIISNILSINTVSTVAQLHILRKKNFDVYKIIVTSDFKDLVKLSLNELFDIYTLAYSIITEDC